MHGRMNQDGKDNPSPSGNSELCCQGVHPGMEDAEHCPYTVYHYINSNSNLRLLAGFRLMNACERDD